MARPLVHTPRDASVAGSPLFLTTPRGCWSNNPSMLDVTMRGTDLAAPESRVDAKGLWWPWAHHHVWT
jgi:hypothetical protein